MTNLPKGWSIAQLGEIVGVIRGRRNPQENAEMPFVGMDNVEAHSMRILDTIPAATMKSSATHFLPGDILYGRLRPYLNKVVQPDFEGLASAEFIPLTPREGVLPEFVRLRINAADFVQFASRLDEGDRPRVDWNGIREFELLLPPTAEQGRITDSLDSLFSRLDSAAKSLETAERKLKAYRASVLKAAVEGRLVPTEAELARKEGRSYEPADVLLERILGERRHRWEEAELAKMKAASKTAKDDRWKAKYEEPESLDLGSLPNLPEGWCWVSASVLYWDAGYGTSAKCTEEGQGPAVLRIPNIVEGRISLDDLKFVTDGAALGPDGCVRPGDFLFIRTNGSRSLIGRGALLLQDADTSVFFASYLIRLRLVTIETCDRWFALAWSGPQVRGQVLRVAASSAGQHNVSLSAASSFAIPLPPAAEQARILAEFERLDSATTVVNRDIASTIARSARLRQAVRRWAFEGRLVDQDPVDEPAEALLARIRSERAEAAAKPKTKRARQLKAAS